MGLFDEVVSLVGKQLSGGQQNGLMEQAMSLLNSPQIGGLSGLVEKFQKGGLGEIVSSWIGTGSNMPVSGDQIAGALGPDQIREIAGKIGIPESQVSDGLASILPQMIDKLTPNGQVPDSNALGGALSSLAEKLLKG